MTQLARDKLITDNMKLVYFVYHQLAKTSLTINNRDDLISEGMLGLCKAANSFDENKGTKFSTYAALCIKNAMLMYIRKLKKYTPHEISLCMPMGRDEEGKTITVEDVIVDEKSSEEYIIEKIMLDEFEKKQTPQDHLILCSLKKGLNQKEIGKLVGISQSYVSRRIKKMRKEFKKQ